MIGSAAKLISILALTGWSLRAQNTMTFIDEARHSYLDAKDNILKSAEEMPEQYYAFRVAAGSRTFGDIVRDIAAKQMNVCSTINGKNHTTGQYSNHKADLIQALQRSLDECDSAYASVTPRNADQEVGFGIMRHSKLGLLFLNATRDHQAYGELMVYLQLQGLIPPSDQAHIVPVD